MMLGIDPMLWALFGLGLLMVPVAYWVKKHQQRTLLKWAEEDREMVEKWKKEQGVEQ